MYKVTFKDGTVNNVPFEIPPEPSDATGIVSVVLKDPTPTTDVVQVSASFWRSLPDEIRGAFLVYRSSITQALEEGDYVAARLCIGNVTVPPELEAVKQQLLDLIPTGP
jgi:hypothetical protein